METSKTNDHLGGHLNRTNIDEGALDWLINTYQPVSFLDIGCGPGGMVELASDKGLYSVGIDGDPSVKNEKIVMHDFEDGTIDMHRESLAGVYDIGWSVEFVEHVYEKFMDNYMPAFQSCKTVVITYAPPGTPGHHHVNLQEEDYWVDKFKQYGFTFDPDNTKKLRASSTMNLKKKSALKRFVQMRGMVFKNDTF
jgi:SAM-dependent methyltransferase|tara:strand:+ start:58 stop:642 length:585 start_codon:yes stop_codon:yes gene_type:complete